MAAIYSVVAEKNGKMECCGFIGLDVHKDTIAVAHAPGDGGALESLAVIGYNRNSLRRLMDLLSREGELLKFCYEAGPCGYGVYREITDRRDALALARLHRSRDLTSVWVPSPQDEAMCDLIRAREDLKGIELRARQRLSAFLLRHGQIYRGGRTHWTQAHFRWLEAQKFDDPAQQIVLQEYVDTVTRAQERVAQLAAQTREAAAGWSLWPAVEALLALRGVNFLTAATVMAELGDLSGFDNPRQLMAFLGLIPSEHSSGQRRRQGAITKTGNAHVRRVLVEAALSYRHPARKTKPLRCKGADAPPEAQSNAWKAHKRLCGRYRRLNAAGKPSCKVTTAIAQELSGFAWAIVCQVMKTPEKDPGKRAAA